MNFGAGPLPAGDASDRRKRKWDVPETAQQRAQKGAAAIVQKINADLAAKRLSITKAAHHPAPVVENPTREIEINETESKIRSNLTKRTLHDEILRQTGCLVITRGRYRPPGVVSEERNLHLYLQASSKVVGVEHRRKAVEDGARYIESLMRKGGSSAGGSSAGSALPSYGAVPSQGGGYSQGIDVSSVPPPMHHLQQHQQGGVMSGLMFVEIPSPDPLFDLNMRLRGVGDANFAHVVRETGTNVRLRGAGTIEDPHLALHLFLECATMQGLESAHRLCENLVMTVREDYLRFDPLTALSNDTPTAKAPWASEYPTVSTPMQQQQTQGQAAWGHNQQLNGYNAPTTQMAHQYPTISTNHQMPHQYTSASPQLSLLSSLSSQSHSQQALHQAAASSNPYSHVYSSSAPQSSLPQRTLSAPPGQGPSAAADIVARASYKQRAMAWRGPQRS
mmetsp:Transcript_9620/g.16530  ORF Transcript_9620/g.16530 Transcript_9620/m.16530 type:complete len:449 (-) Transcript_9620:484-1830(-)